MFPTNKTPTTEQQADSMTVMHFGNVQKHLKSSGMVTGIGIQQMLVRSAIRMSHSPSPKSKTFSLEQCLESAVADASVKEEKDDETASVSSEEPDQLLDAWVESRGFASRNSKGLPKDIHPYGLSDILKKNRDERRCMHSKRESTDGRVSTGRRGSDLISKLESALKVVDPLLANERV